jgi:polysaccharide export outer membrane protein
MSQALHRSIAALCGLFFLAIALLHTAAHADLYALGPGDTININVFQESDLSLESKISHNGTIDYPLIDPQISVSIVSYRPFFVNGAVRSPGRFEYQPGMTVRRAVVVAGDFTARASRNKIYIIKEGQSSASRKKIKLDEPIGPGDTITVKESLF